MCYVPTAMRLRRKTNVTGRKGYTFKRNLSKDSSIDPLFFLLPSSLLGVFHFFAGTSFVTRVLEAGRRRNGWRQE